MNNFIPGKRTTQPYPLSRFLPPYFEGIAKTWLAGQFAPGSWLLDPFGASPRTAIEAAQNGYRVLLAANNPILRFILETQSRAWTKSDFQAAIAALAGQTIGRERLEPHLLARYQTDCNECGRSVTAQAFLWQAEPLKPIAKQYHCPHCGASGPKPTTPEDIHQAATFALSPLHRSRAMERVTPLDDPDRKFIVEALEAYLPRTIMAMMAIINKLPRLEPEQQKMIQALLLVALDRTNTLWGHPAERPRPRQITMPPQFWEHNLWQEMETAVDLWLATQTRVEIVLWPEQPLESGGICIYEGRIRDLAETLQNTKISAILTVFPRPNQAFWSLSAVWAGWLWGPEAVDHFKSVLRRRRYDWHWHTTAIAAALGRLKPNLPAPTPFLGIINENEPGFLTAVMLGAQQAALNLQAVSVRMQDQQAQLTWAVESPPGQKAPRDDRSAQMDAVFLQAGQAYLRARGEPAEYLQLQAAALTTWFQQNRLPESDPKNSEVFGSINENLQRAFRYMNGFVRYGGSSNSLESGKWWLKEPGNDLNPLSDQVEMAIVQLLLKKPGYRFHEIETEIMRAFSDFSPEAELISEILESYAWVKADAEPIWQLRPEDQPKQRRADLREMNVILTELGKRLGFNTQSGNNWVLWGQPKNGYIFQVSASAILGKYIFAKTDESNRNFLVVPGSRANLISYKCQTAPNMEQIVQKSWRFLKFRHLRQISTNTDLTLEKFEALLDLDPLAYTQPQMRFL